MKTRLADRIAEAAQTWAARGEDRKYLWDGFQGMFAVAWGARHKGANDPRVTPEIERFINAISATVDLDDIWRNREYCSACGETYKVENLDCCSDCETNLCPRHATTDHVCPRCGGEMF